MGEVKTAVANLIIGGNALLYWIEGDEKFNVAKSV